MEISLQSKRKEGLKDMNKPLLSISMLVSNGRKDTIQRCMESLAQLRKSVSCELVLVDTGCTDGSIDIAKKYTDKVLNFVWCNDFSAARNVGLKACIGEWFLYLDDDEWFEDTRELEDFFISGSYKNYEAAWYIQRNYDNLQGTAYTDCYVSRMCRRTSETRFCGRIHEWLEPLSNKIAMLGSYVHHYGYVYSSEEERQKHLLRNLTLEEAAVAERPDDIRMCCQLVQEYRAANRYEDAEALCRKTLQTSKYGTKNAFMQYLITCIPRIYAEQGKNEEAYDEFVRLEQKEELASYARALCAFERIITAGRLHKDERLLQSVEEYIDLMEEYSLKDGEHPVMDFAAYTSEKMKEKVVEYGIQAMFRLGNYAKADYLFSRVNWNGKNGLPKELCLLFFKCYAETQNSILFQKVFPELLKRKEEIEVVYAAIEDILTKYREKKSMILEDVEKAGRRDGYFSYLHLCFLEDKGKDLTEALMEYFSEEGRRHDDEVTALLLCKREYLSIILPKVSIESLAAAVELMTQGKDRSQLEELEEQIQDCLEGGLEGYEVILSYVIMSLCKKELFLRVQGRERVTECLQNVVYATMNYCEQLYQPTVLQEDCIGILPGQYRAIYMLGRMFEEDASNEEIAVCIRKAVREDAGLRTVLQCFLEERKQADNERETNVNAELRQLGQQIRAMVIAQLQEGKRQEALALLLEVEKMLPGEDWIAELKNKCSLEEC